MDENGDGFASPEECVDPEPRIAWFRDGLGGDVVIDVVPSFGSALDYPGAALSEIGRLIVKVRDDFAGDSAEIVPGPVRWRSGSLELEAEPGAFSAEIGDDGVVRFPFSRAVSVAGGTVQAVLRSLLRGDANADGNVDVSDALVTLNYLFFGSDEPACLDAADANDSGEVDISDPIFLLGALFLGGDPVPPPFPDCGPDPSGDALGCAERCST